MRVQLPGTGKALRRVGVRRSLRRARPVAAADQSDGAADRAAVAGALKKNNRWEDELCRQIRVAGLPEPVREFRFHAVRRWRIDLAYPGSMIGVEVDGGLWTRGRHLRPLGYRKDAEKFAEAAVLGWRLIRVVPEQIRDGSALRWLAGLLAGAPGSPAPPSSASSSRRGRF